MNLKPQYAAELENFLEFLGYFCPLFSMESSSGPSGPHEMQF